jgi:phage gp37-like protein
MNHALANAPAVHVTQLKGRNMKRKHTAQSKHRDELATVAMHGLLMACSSPQFWDRIAETARHEKTTPYRVIAHTAYNIALAMQLEGRS